jgi:hypothetical protein
MRLALPVVALTLALAQPAAATLYAGHLGDPVLCVWDIALPDPAGGEITPDAIMDFTVVVDPVPPVLPAPLVLTPANAAVVAGGRAKLLATPDEFAVIVPPTNAPEDFWGITGPVSLIADAGGEVCLNVNTCLVSFPRDGVLRFARVVPEPGMLALVLGGLGLLGWKCRLT